MRNRAHAFLSGVGLAIIALALMAPTGGGFPSRPKFQALTVGGSTLAGTGDVRINAGALGIAAAPNSTDGTLALASGSYNETTAPAISAAYTAGATLVATPRASDAWLGTAGAHSLILATNGANRYEINSVGSHIFYSSAFLQNTTPVLTFQETDAATDETLYRIQTAGGVLTWAAQDDSITPATDFLTVDRTGTTVDSAVFGNLTGATSVGVASSTDTYLSTGSGGSIAFARGAVLADAAGVEFSNYTGTVTGCTTNPAPSVEYTFVGMRGDGITTQGIVNLRLGGFTCTSNATSFTVTGMPAEYRPTTTQGLVTVAVQDNGTLSNYTVRMTNGGVLEFFRNGSATGWTASGTKGPPNAIQVHYQIQ